MAYSQLCMVGSDFKTHAPECVDVSVPQVRICCSCSLGGDPQTWSFLNGWMALHLTSTCIRPASPCTVLEIVVSIASHAWLIRPGRQNPGLGAPAGVGEGLLWLFLSIIRSTIQNFQPKMYFVIDSLNFKSHLQLPWQAQVK